jgi:DNA-binding MarR family transcriptional regulator
MKEQANYEALAELRYQIRCFQHFSEEMAREAGLEPHQHQLLLALKGLPKGTRPRIAELAERLQVRHHSAVELADRMEERGYIRRERGEDRREVLLSLTSTGEKVLRKLSVEHEQELMSRGPALIAALERALGRKPASAGARAASEARGTV